MRRMLAALVFSLAAVLGAPAMAQDAAASKTVDALDAVLNTELPPERMALASKLVELSGTTRLFDELLPNIADQAKNAFIRANPQMQLGIISVVDKVAIEMVSRRPELNRYLARIWASGYTDEEMQELIDFFSTETGKKFAGSLPRILAVQTAAAQEWAKSVGAELTDRVQKELRAAMAAEQNALQSDVAGPAAETPTPQQ